MKRDSSSMAHSSLAGSSSVRLTSTAQLQVPPEELPALVEGEGSVHF